MVKGVTTGNDLAERNGFWFFAVANNEKDYDCCVLRNVILEQEF